MRQSTKINNSRAVLFYVISFLLLFSCNNNTKEVSKLVETARSYAPPVIFMLDKMPPPKEVELKNVPPPRVVVVPKKPGGSYKGLFGMEDKSIPLRPPVVTRIPIPTAHFTNFNTEDGLALPSLQSGLMDKKGRLWFATMGGGVTCYDGARFTNFTMTQGFAQAAAYWITEDKNGHLWFGTYAGGVSRYDGKKFTNYTTKDGLADNTVFHIGIDNKDHLWFATSQTGVTVYDGKKFTIIDTSNGLPSNYIACSNQDSKGNIWLLSGERGIICYDGKNYKTYTTEDGLPTNNFSSFFEDSNGVLWFGTYENGVCRYDGNKFTTIKTGPDPASNTVTDIIEDDNGDLWFSTFGAGVIRYDGKELSGLTTEQGLAGNSVNSITKDRYGNLWFGTFGGLSRYNGDALAAFTVKQGLPENYTMTIAEDREGNLWLGTNGDGIMRYDGEKFTQFTTEQGLPNNTVSYIFEDKENKLWFCTSGGGISRYDGKNFTTFSMDQGLPNNQVATMAQDKNGDLWMGTRGSGVAHYDGNKFTTFTTEQGLADNTVISTMIDKKGNVWFGTASNGVSCFDGKRFTNFSTKQGLKHNSVIDIHEDKHGNLWFGTQGGLSRFDGSGFITFNSSHGLPEDYVCFVEEDEEGVMWLGTYKGFCSLKFKTPGNDNKPEDIKGAGLLQISNDQLKSYEPVCDVYNEKTGYPVKDMIDASIVIKKRNFPGSKAQNDIGVIWAPTGDPKLIRFDPKAVVHHLAPPAVFIRSINIEEQAINWYDLAKTRSDSVLIAQQEATVFGNSLPEKVRDSINEKFREIQFDSITPFYQVPINLVLPHKHNRVSFDFGAIETSRNFMVRYQYMLEGYDKEWSPITENTSASYGNISEGDYTFKLKARSPEGVWSEPIAYSFKVLPPWWRTWWFRTIMGVSLLLVLYGLYRWRTAALHKQKRHLEQTVKLRTAELVKQKEKSDELLLNILPSEVANELKEKGYTTAKSFDEVTVLFSDIKGFTNVAEKLTAQELVQEINTYFSAFDNIMLKYGLEKIKTIGDAYVAAGGLPEKNSATAQNVIEAAIAMQKQVEELKQERVSASKPYFELRIGIHTGPVVAGVVGIKKFQYDIWGDTVNLAARMEQSGVPGKINISQQTYELVKEQFNCVHRGKIEAKNKGNIDMYFVE